MTRRLTRAGLVMAAWWACACTTPASATEFFNGNVTLAKVATFSSSRPANPSTQPYVTIEMASDTFAGTSCSGGYANIKKTDTALVTAAMVAITNGGLIQLAVDDSLMDGGTCQVTLIKLL